MKVLCFDIVVILPIPDINDLYELDNEDDLYDYLFNELNSSELCLFDDIEIQEIKNITHILIDNFNKHISLYINHEYRKIRVKSPQKYKSKYAACSGMINMNENTYKKLVLLFGDNMSKSFITVNGFEVERVQFYITRRNAVRFIYTVVILE